ncbi:hypothetical protein Tco_0824874 [Tanacetum coccineum]
MAVVAVASRGGLGGSRGGGGGDGGYSGGGDGDVSNGRVDCMVVTLEFNGVEMLGLYVKRSTDESIWYGCTVDVQQMS